MTDDRRIRGRSWAGAMILFLSVWAGCTPALARAEVAAAPATMASQPVQPGEVDLSPAAIQSRLQQVESAADLGADSKAKLEETYKQALTQLQLADEWARRTEQWDVPTKLLTEIKSQTAASASQPVYQVPTGLALDQLKEQYTAAKGRLSDADKTAADLRTKINALAARRQELPQRLAEVRSQLVKVNEQLTSPSPQANDAERILLRVRQKALSQEIASYTKESLTFDVRTELLMRQRDQVVRQREWLSKQVKALEDALAEAQKQQATAMEQQAREAARRAAHEHPLVAELAQENLRLAEQLNGSDGLLAKSQAAATKSADIQTRVESLKRSFEIVRRRVQRAGLTQVIANLLQRRRAELRDIRKTLLAESSAGDDITTVQIERDELQDARNALSNIERRVRRILAKAPTAMTEVERQNLSEAIREQLENRLKYLDEILAAYKSYTDTLVELDTNSTQLRQTAEAFLTYIDERILWLRSAPRLGWAQFREASDAAAWLVQPGRWQEAAGRLWDDTVRNSFLPLLAAAALAAPILLKRKINRSLLRLDTIGGDERQQMKTTMRAIILTAILASSAPTLLAWVGWRWELSSPADSFPDGLGRALLTVAYVWLTLRAVRCVCMRGGLGEKQFHWNTGIRLIHWHLLWLTPAMVLLAFLAALTQFQAAETWGNSLGRLAFLLAMVLLSVFLQRILRLGGGMGPRDGARQWGYVWYALFVALPLALAIVAWLGYYYMALELGARLLGSIWLILALVLVRSAIVRWLLLVRRKMALREAQKAVQQAREAHTGPEAPMGEPISPTLESKSVDIVAISSQTLRLLRVAIVACLLLGLWFIWSDMLPTLRMAGRRPLWSSDVTLADLGWALAVLAVMVVALRNIPGLLEFTVLQHLPLDRGVSFAITTLCRYAITIVGIVVAMGMVGIGWAKVQWVAAAVTVGLGFGLQEIFANFVSGLIILFERPMRVGDVVTVGETSGMVTRIRIRATTITDWDNKELIVPNKELVTGRLTNWTLSSGTTRLTFPVSIACGSDTNLARQLLLKVAREHPHVMKDPPAGAFFLGFGKNSLTFELRVFVAKLEQRLETQHELNVAIEKAFREAHIEIA